MIIETICLSILKMVSRCATPDVTMLRWIAYIKSLNLEIRRILGKDMLSKAQFEGADVMVSEDEEVKVDFLESAQLSVKK